MNFITGILGGGLKTPKFFPHHLASLSDPIFCPLSGVKNQGFNYGKNVEKKISQLKKAKHGFYFCNRDCKEEAQKLGGKCPQIRPAHFGTGTGVHSYRSAMKEEIKAGCIDCFNKTEYLLVVHHKDGDRQNNKKENLEVVCRNCHIKRHLYLKNGEWCFWSSSLTPREMLISL